jgi:3,4-dihydroxy 2-butanone 4-phosphate synthase/GTP cyclohydrolase II
MVPQGNDPNGTAFTVTVDSVETSTGVSACDRAVTFKQLADFKHKAAQFSRPGHIFPLIAKPGGVIERQGHTEAAVDLCKLAGVSPVGLIGEIVNKDGSMKRLDDCFIFAEKYGLKVITVEAMISYIRELANREETDEERKTYFGDRVPFENNESSPKSVDLIAQCELPVALHGNDLGTWTMKCFYSHFDGRYHVSLECGDLTREPYDPVLTRVHSECFTGDILGSRRCDCGEQLEKSLVLIRARGRGVLIYNVGHEGRGIGLANKIQAYHLQQSRGMNTYEANHALGFTDDLRQYNTAKNILKKLGIQKIQLLTTNGAKIDAFEGMVSSVIGLDGTPNEHNKSYLNAKKQKQAQEFDPSRVSVKTLPSCASSVGKPDESEKSASVSSLIPSVKSESNGLEKKNGASELLGIFTPERIAALKIGIVKTQWNHALVDKLAANVRRELEVRGVHYTHIQEMTVPGSFETMWAAQELVKTCDAVICIGLLIKGETLHFEIISEGCVHGLKDVQLKSGVPVINGILNCLTEGQAEARCNVEECDLYKSWAGTVMHMGLLKLNSSA